MDRLDNLQRLNNEMGVTIDTPKSRRPRALSPGAGSNLASDSGRGVSGVTSADTSAGPRVEETAVAGGAESGEEGMEAAGERNGRKGPEPDAGEGAAE